MTFENLPAHSRDFSRELAGRILPGKISKNADFFLFLLLCIWYNKDGDKYMIISDNFRLTHGRGYVYSLQYHLVWCTKYRKQILKGNIEDAFKRQLQLVMDELPGTIMEMEVMPDHVHLLVDCSPQFFIPDAIKRLKGQTAKKLFELFPDIKKSLWDEHLWNPSYCAVSVSDRSIEQVKQYIREQKTKD